MCSRTNDSHSRSNSSIDSRSIPGMEPTGWRCFVAFHHEYRVNQRIHVKLRFAHQPAGKFVAAHAPHAGVRK